MNVGLLAAGGCNEVDFPRNRRDLSFGIFLIAIDDADVNGAFADHQLIENDVLHDMRHFLLAETDAGISQPNVLTVVFIGIVKIALEMCIRDSSMRADASFAVPVKLWALLCVFAGVTIGGNVLLTCILTGGALLYLVLQRNFRLAASYGCFYLLLALLLYGIRFHGLHMPVFSEFYVLMFWNLSPIFLVSWDLITTPPGMLSAFLSRLRMPTPFILGLLVVFRFFPTMRTELKGVGRSMKNRGLTAAGQLLAHPVQSMEYVLIPFLLRVLQLADQLSVSAVARGAERPGVRGSYYEKRAGTRDRIAAAACALVTASYLVLERSMA